MNTKAEAEKAKTELLKGYKNAVKGRGLFMAVDIGNDRGQYSLEVRLHRTSPLSIVNYKKIAKEVEDNVIPRTQDGFAVNIQYIDVIKRR